MKKLMLAFFILVLLSQCTSIALDIPAITFITKPLIVLSLIGYYYQAIAKPSLLFLFALFFCWLGDISLMFQNSNGLFFIFGLLCFLLGHVFFILHFRQARNTETGNTLLSTQKARFAFPILLAGSGLVITLLPFLGEMKIPVLIYACVITVMVLQASFRYGQTSMESYWLVFGGAFLFMTSDTILALNKFKEPIISANLYIMITYMAAQFCIVQGIVKHPIATK
jgi:uncharacterized membrane protein YhhN